MAYEQPKTVKASFFAVVEPVWRSWGKDDKDRPILEGAKVKNITQKRPQGRTSAGAIITRLTLEFDAGAFLPLQPEAVIHIGADQFELVEVEADAPEPDEDHSGARDVGY